MRLSQGEKIVKSARPNGHYVALVSGVDYFYVYTCMSMVDDEPVEDEYEHDTLAAAQQSYDEEVAAFTNVRNEAAQAAYDEAHGTDNGYAEHDYHREF